MKEIQIHSDALDVAGIYKSCSEAGAGAVVLFVGTVRNKTKSKEVVRLEYEAYERMAIKEMDKIVSAASEKWPVISVIVHHRVGILNIGDEAVVIAVCTPHRQDAYEASRYIIDTLKETVPIWKKEVFIDGEEWVSATP